MRLLVACPECKRQFDASGKAPGSRFRCHCGEQVSVPSPRGHDAVVVRCSSCGAPRVEQATACGHCDSDFTIHECDLDTVCPTCFARVSDQARYCHHCATPLTPELIAGDETPRVCPVCGPERNLVSRRFSKVEATVLECQHCGGLWLGLESIHSVLDSEERNPRSVATPQVASSARPTKSGYRPCVVCSQLMPRRNFGRGESGVIVDVCGSHGIWFDADEFSQLIAWIRAGGLEAARLELARLKNSQDPIRKRQAMRESNRGTKRPIESPNSEPSPDAGSASCWPDLAIGVLEFAARVFHLV